MSTTTFERPVTQRTTGSPYSKKAQHFAAHMRRKAMIADELDKVGEHKAAASLRECHTTEHLTGCTACGAAWWVTTKCRSRICPICAWKTAQARAQLIQHMIIGLKHPKFITLTMPRWDGDPGEGISFLRKAFGKLRKSGGIPGLEGGCYSIEVIPKDDGWHIHMHLIVDCSFTPHKKLIAAWGQALGVTSPSVDIRDAAGQSAAKYVAKYVTKSLDPKDGPEAFAKLYQAIAGMRLFSLFGKWYRSAPMVEALQGARDHVRCKCPACGELGTLFDVRCGRFVFGKDWDNISKFWLGKATDATRKKADMISLGKEDAPEDEPLISVEYDDEEDFELSPVLT